MACKNINNVLDFSDSGPFCQTGKEAMKRGYAQTEPLINGNRFYKLSPAGLSLQNSISRCEQDGATMVGYESVDQREEVRQAFQSLGK